MPAAPKPTTGPEQIGQEEKPAAIPEPSYQKDANNFVKHWRVATADSNIALYSFRRFKTTHLLNLRFLEAEISELDYQIYQTGLSLDIPPSPTDRLGLKHCKRDKSCPAGIALSTRESVLRLRDLVKEYDKALLNSSKLLSMDTISLIDDENQCRLRDDLTFHEMYKTRLVRIDQEPRSRHDPLQRWLYECLRLFRYHRMGRKYRDTEKCKADPSTGSYQHTFLITSIACRVVVALLTASFLIVPMVILTRQSKKENQILVISIFILVFASMVSIMLRTSSLEVMAVSAAYSAILSVFVSNLQKD